MDSSNQKRQKTSSNSFEKLQKIVRENSNNQQYVMPGQLITTETGYLRGHGTYEKDNKLYASVSGVVDRVNKLITVKPLRARYHGEVGDVVVGRVSEVLQKSWRIDLNGRNDAVLMLSAVNLPGGVLRRKLTSDELQMRSFFQENDLISAEVQQLYSDGSVILHTRSLKYGKLGKGLLVTVPAVLIKRVKNHFYSFSFGVDMILGCNGYIWLCENEEQAKQHTTVPASTREKICRVRNAIVALSNQFIQIYPDSIQETYLYSIEKQIQTKDMLISDVMEDITSVARAKGSSMVAAEL